MGVREQLVNKLAILIPVLGRPHLIGPLVTNIEETTRNSHRTIFVCSPGDDDAIAACQETSATTLVAPFEQGWGDFAKKINYAFASCDEPWLFQGATDLRFRGGWDEKALRLAEAARVGVVGTNDLGNPLVIRGRAATHIIFSRAYIEEWGGTIDGSGTVFSERYSHQFVDTEFVQLATMRRQFRPCRAAIVEHLHPNWRKAESDEVYEKAMRHFDKDARLFTKRMQAIKRALRQGAR